MIRWENGILIFFLLVGCGKEKYGNVDVNDSEGSGSIPSGDVSTKIGSGILSFHEKTEVFPQIQTIDDREGFSRSLGPGYSFGIIETGSYTGAEIVTAPFESDEPCKGEGCTDLFARFIKKGSELIFLPKNSSAHLQEKKIWVSTFSSYGYDFRVDDDYSLDLLTPIQTFSYALGKFVGVSSSLPLPDKHTLKKVFQHPLYGDVFSDGTYFYVHLPDGRHLVLSFIPDVTIDQIVWNSTGVVKNKSGFTWGTQERFGSPYVPYETYVSSLTVNPNQDLVQIGETRRGDPIYGLKDEGHRLLKEFYSDFEKSVEHQSENDLTPSPPISYSDFVRAVPFFFWKDPFERLTRFTNNDFLSTFLAEPIIYLYSPSRQKVRVQVFPKEGISKSEPPYENGWNVYAEPDGSVTHLSGQEFPYLFWEGFGPVRSMGEEGYVVKKEEIGDFFDSLLPQLGLLGKEIDDFKKAWLPHFLDASYYFITFIDPQTINRLAPLVVSPQPETTIRVLMDYQPLSREKQVNPPTIPPPPQRKGFTLVEWGGIRRF